MPTQLSGVNNTACVGSQGSICTASKRFTAVKEACFDTGADLLKYYLMQSEGVDWSVTGL